MSQKWSKEIVVRHILKRRGAGQPLNSGYMQVHCRPLYQAGCNCFDNWQKTIEAAGLSYDEVRVLQKARPKWGDGKVIEAIQEMQKHGEPLNSNYAQTKKASLYRATVKYYGGWAQAIAAAGLDYSKLRKKDPMRSWTKATIIAEVLRRHEQGLSIRGGDVNIQDRGLYQAVNRFFGKGGWARARTLAGFDPVDPRPWKEWDEQTIPEEIKRLYENGVELNTGALYGSPYRYIHSAGRAVFGSWAKAVKAAGLDYKKIRKQRYKWWTRTRIIMAIQSLDRRGVRLSSKATNLSNGGLFGAAVNLFGSWGQAVEAAGISYRKHCRTWSTKAWLRRMRTDEYANTLEKARTQARKWRTA